MCKSFFATCLSFIATGVIAISASVNALSVSAFEKETYVPRLEVPENDPEAEEYRFYFSDENVFNPMKYAMPNCTAYAWGRSFELLGSAPSLSRDNAGRWYKYNSDNHFYSYGCVPKLGAVACWDLNDLVTGHVATVENVSDDNGTITVSESQWKKEMFTTYTFNSDSSDHMTYYRFIGYIYIDETEGKNYGDAYRIGNSSETLLCTSENKISFSSPVNPDKNKTINQNFRFEPTDHNTYKIWSLSANTLLSRNGNSVNFSENDDSCEWIICDDADGKYTICSTEDMNSVLTYDTDSLHISEYTGLPEQTWDINRVTGYEALETHQRASIMTTPAPATAEEINYPEFELNCSNAKTSYYTNDILDLSNIDFIVNGKKIETPDLSQLSAEYNFSTSGEKTVKIKYGTFNSEYVVNVTDEEETFVIQNNVLFSAMRDMFVNNDKDVLPEYDINLDGQINCIDIVTLRNL